MADKKVTLSKCSKARNTTKEIARQCAIGVSYSNLTDKVSLLLDDEFADDKHDYTVHIPFEEIDKIHKFIHRDD